MQKQERNHIEYLAKLYLLNRVKEHELITDREYNEMKKFYINKYKVQDLIWS